MYLLLSILLAAILGCLLLLLSPLLAGIIAFGIIAGTLFRAVYMLNKIYKTLPQPPDRVTEAYQNYLKDHENSSQD
ncbi:hypothetical protein [Bacillus infantis]|uniref:hypothetical protein n=1 Tax=Bacillus infantis TaxID=324767 RepID=UPI003CEED948